MKEASDRLRELRIKKGFSTASDAAKAFGWNENTYKSHESGIRGIRPDAARKYASAFNSTPAYILVGADARASAPNGTIVHVPVIARVSAGAFRYDDGVEEGVQVPAVPRGDISAALQYSVVVDGPSVNKRIPDGAYAICSPFDRFPGGAQHGQLVHVVRERAGLHEHTIKELRFSPTGMKLVPCSTDPRYQDEVDLSAPEEDTLVRIVGVVIGIYQPL